MMRAASNSMLMPTAVPPGPAYWGLCFTAETAGATIALTSGTSAPTVSVVTSFDGTTWTPYTIGTNITLAAIGDKVYFAAGDGGNSRFARSVAYSHNFKINGQIAATGSIMSLLDRDNENLRAFSNGYVFCNLFSGCTSLTQAPVLPATTLASTCYGNMFEGCTSLTTAPVLPATTFTSYCYRSMFSGCTALADITVAFQSWGSAVAAFSSWVAGVAASGTFRCPTALGTDETIERGANRCPEGWTVINI